MKINITITMRSNTSLKKVSSEVVIPIFKVPSNKIYDKKLYDDNTDTALHLDLELCDNIIPIIGLDMDNLCEVGCNMNHYEIYISTSLESKPVLEKLQTMYCESLVGNLDYINNSILISDIEESRKECGFAYIIGAETCYYPSFSFYRDSTVFCKNKSVNYIDDIDRSSIYPVKMKAFSFEPGCGMHEIDNTPETIKPVIAPVSEDTINHVSHTLTEVMNQMTYGQLNRFLTGWEELVKELKQNTNESQEEEPIELPEKYLAQLDMLDNIVQTLFDQMSPGCLVEHNQEMLSGVVEYAKDILLQHGYAVCYPGIIYDEKTGKERIQAFYYPDKKNEE